MAGAAGEPHAVGDGAMRGHAGCFGPLVLWPAVRLPGGLGVWTHWIGDPAWRLDDGEPEHSGCVDE